MRRLVLPALIAAVLIASAAASAGATKPTWLRITYWDDAASATPSEVWTLRCNPPRGTLSRPAVACRKLSAGGPKLFAPTPPDTACTQIYGGPQKARIVGVVSGKRILTTFTRTDGCQISRWNALSPWLLPRGGVR